MPDDLPDTPTADPVDSEAHHEVLLCRFEDWPAQGGNFFTVAILVPFLLGVVIALIMYFNAVLPTRFDLFVWTAMGVMLVGTALIYQFSKSMMHPSMLREIRKFRRGGLASRFRARFLIAAIRGRSSRARLASRWRGPRVVLIGLRPDVEMLAGVQVFEPIDISGSPREYLKKRPIRYIDIHLSAMYMAIGASFLATAFQRGSVQTWSLWFIPTLPIAWVAVWWFRRSRTSSILAWMPIQVVSTVVEPGRVTRTVLGFTRVFDAASSLLFIRPEIRSDLALAKAKPETLQVRVTLMNSHGHRSSFKVLGADHPTLADLISRWTYPVGEADMVPA